MANKFVRPDGTVEVRIIKPGKGSSAHYEREQIERDMGVVGGKGTQIFLDHPGRKEESDRPERSIRDLCAVSVADPIYKENGPVGPGAYTKAYVFKPYQELVEEIGPYIGVSIRATGSVVTKKINGESVRVAEKFTSGGFDFVTKAGAGGKVVPFTESARTSVTTYVEEFLKDHPQESESSESARAQFIEWATGESQEEEEDMSEELKEKVTTLETENAALKESLAKKDKALVLVEALKLVDEVLLAEKDFPEMAKARVKAQFTEAPMKDDAVDKDALTAAVKEAVKTERTYIESLSPKKGIVGMGQATAPDDAGKQRLRESQIAYHMQQGEPKEKAEALADLVIAGR